MPFVSSPARLSRRGLSKPSKLGRAKGVNIKGNIEFINGGILGARYYKCFG